MLAVMKKPNDYTFCPVAAAVAALLLAATAQAQDAAPQTIVITATRYAMLATDAPAALSVITRREIEARGADNVLDAVRCRVARSAGAR
jgi:outer membrane receptor for ferrienterochelin and colicin